MQFSIFSTFSPTTPITVSIQNCTVQNGAAIGGFGATSPAGGDNNAAGGGGAGLGGAVFVGDGSSLILVSPTTMTGNMAQGGDGGINQGTGPGDPGNPGTGYANDVFLFRQAQLVFNGPNDWNAILLFKPIRQHLQVI